MDKQSWLPAGMEQIQFDVNWAAIYSGSLVAALWLSPPSTQFRHNIFLCQKVFTELHQPNKNQTGMFNDTINEPNLTESILPPSGLCVF